MGFTLQTIFPVGISFSTRLRTTTYYFTHISTFFILVTLSGVPRLYFILVTLLGVSETIYFILVTLSRDFGDYLLLESVT